MRSACSGSWRKGRREGIALVLVLVFVGVAVVLGGALVAMDQNGPAIGDNAMSAVQADWAAQSASSLAVAALEAGLSQTMNAGELSSTITVGGATTEVRVTNMAGDQPTTDDRELLLRASATIGGMTNEEVRVLSVPVPIDDAADAVDPMLTEFAVFANGGYRWRSGAQMGFWRLDPAAATAKRLNIGLGFSGVSNLQMDRAAQSNQAFFRDRTSDLGLELGITLVDLLGYGYKMNCEVPACPAAVPAGISSLATSASTMSCTAPGERTVTLPRRYTTNSTVSNTGILRFRESNGAFYAVNNMNVTTSGVLLFNGNVTLHVRGNLTVQNDGIIALENDSSRVTILVSGDVIIDDAHVGVPLSIAQADGPITNMTSFTDPRRLKIMQVRMSDGGSSSGNWWIANNSQVIANIIGPRSNFELTASTLVGRVTAGRVDLRGGGKLLYAPSMDRGVGFTSKGGPLFGLAGTLGAVTSGVGSILNAVVPENGLDAMYAALGAIAMSNETTVVSVSSDEKAAKIEKRTSVAEAADD